MTRTLTTAVAVGYAVWPARCGIPLHWTRAGSTKCPGSGKRPARGVERPRTSPGN